MAKPTWEMVNGHIVLVGGTKEERDEAYRKAAEVAARIVDLPDWGIKEA